MKLYTNYTTTVAGLADVEATVEVIQKVAASSILTSRTRLSALSGYYEDLSSIISRLLLFLPGFEHPYLAGNTSRTGRPAVVLIGSDKGIVSGLWHRVIDSLDANARKESAIIAVGEKTEEYCKEEGIAVSQSFGGRADDARILDGLFSYLIERYSSGEYSHIDVMYPHSEALSYQEVRSAQYLPHMFDRRSDMKEDELGLPIFESSPARIMTALLSRYLRTALAVLLQEARVAEFSARTVASEKAQEKTRDLIDTTRRTFRNERRRELTMKQLEMFVSHTMV